MNLEIKFRAFDKARKEMFFLPVIDGENKNWLQIDKTGINVGTKNGLLSGNEFELMQFTGFVDKKGNDIYKGDIFRFEDSNEDDVKLALADFFDISKNSFNEVIFYTLKYKDKYDLEKLLKGSL